MSQFISTVSVLLFVAGMFSGPGTTSVFAAASDLSGGSTGGSTEDWIPLFNGRNLDGWTPKITGHVLGDNYADTFRVEGGVLKVDYAGYAAFEQRFGHLFYERPYSYYRLRIDYRFTGVQAPGGPGAWAVRNSGVMVHAQSPQSMLLDQDFPISIEAQFLGGLGDGTPRPTASVCTPGTEIVFRGGLYPQHCLVADAPTQDGDQWVSVEVEVLGAAQISHRVNGELVLAYQLPQIGGGVVHNFDPAEKPDGRLLDTGYIAMQSESAPIEFRRVALLNLEGCMNPEDRNYRKHFVRSDSSACLVAGQPRQ